LEKHCALLFLLFASLSQTLAGCGGPDAGCKVESNVGARELAQAKATLESDFSLVLLTEWLSSEGQGQLMAANLCFAWPRPLRNVPRGISAGEMRLVPEFTPKRYSGKGIPEGWEKTVASGVLERLAVDNALDFELFGWAADLILSRVRAVAGVAIAAQLPHLNSSKAIKSAALVPSKHSRE
jgi:hypothetical protein